MNKPSSSPSDVLTHGQLAHGQRTPGQPASITRPERRLPVGLGTRPTPDAPMDRHALPIRWPAPVQFTVTPRVTARSEPSFTTTRALRFHLGHSPLNRQRQPVLLACRTRVLRVLGLALSLSLSLPLLLPAQSLWKDEVSKPMFADKRAGGVGDIITILVQESTTSSKDNKTETGKESSMDASLSSFFYSPAASGALTKNGTMPALKWDSKSGFAGGGSINNSEKLSARAAVQVMDVLPNRNLVIEGRRETSVGGEQQTMVLRGIIRPEDVMANNTVFSYNVADATIQILSKGTITDSQRKGWFHKVWDKVSPF